MYGDVSVLGRQHFERKDSIMLVGDTWARMHKMSFRRFRGGREGMRVGASPYSPAGRGGAWPTSIEDCVIFVTVAFVTYRVVTLW